MTEPSAVRTALLELGLEDWIPLPEAVETVRMLAADQPERHVRDALIALGRDGRIRFWRGVWDREDAHVEVSARDAEMLLQDEKWFRFRLDEAEEEERLYFVNVENVAPPSR